LRELAQALAGRPGLLTSLVLLAALALTLIWESWRRYKSFPEAPPSRLAGNYGLLLVNHAAAFLIAPASAALAAVAAAALSPAGGPLAGLGFGWQAVLSLLVFDLAAWLLHRALHANAWLWRVHEVHHTDTVFDTALAFRFHPLEVALVACVTTALVAVLGLPPAAVLVAICITTAHNVFVHANARLPGAAERCLSWICITPDLHRLHHAEEQQASACNYGTVLSVWDRMAGTLRVEPAPARFGVLGGRGQQDAPAWRLLLAPFRRRVG